MKSLTGNAEPIKQGIVQPEEAIRYVLSLPIASLVSGSIAPGSETEPRYRAAVYAHDHRRNGGTARQSRDVCDGRAVRTVQSPRIATTVPLAASSTESLDRFSVVLGTGPALACEDASAGLCWVRCIRSRSDRFLGHSLDSILNALSCQKPTVRQSNSHSRLPAQILCSKPSSPLLFLCGYFYPGLHLQPASPGTSIWDL